MDLPQKQGLYDPANEHDACGVGFIAHIKGEKRHDIVLQGLEILKNLDGLLGKAAEGKKAARKSAAMPAVKTAAKR